MTAVDVVIMAAGKGTRMKSALPKVLHKVAGRALLGHVLRAAAELGARERIVVVGHGADAVRAAFADDPLASGARFVLQEPQQGTGHAVQQAMPLLADDGITVVLNGDVPLIDPLTLRELVAACAGRQLALLTCELDDPTGYGRIVRAPLGMGGGDAEPPQPQTTQPGPITGIVEHKDATAHQRGIREIYTGFLAAPTRALRGWLAQLRPDNAQGEYYLTDVVALAVRSGMPVVAAHPGHADEVAGVNSAAQLAEVERAHQRRQARALMDAGVRLADPARFDVRGTLRCGVDVEIDVNCVFEGEVLLGDGVRVGANCVLRDCRVAPGVEIAPFTHIEGAEIGAGARVGPFARLRPGARLGEEVHIGNFVEVKNSTLARGAKANHLAYLGDATVGERVNYGAGAITANYDGANKHRTTIGDDVHVGSNAVLVAPVDIGAGGTVGAGSVIAKDTPAGSLSVTRAPQRSIANWQRPKKKTG